MAEALRRGETVTAALWASEPSAALPGVPQYLVPQELLDYVSPLKNAGRVVFAVQRRQWKREPSRRALVLETVQDPGNLGTILRTANAMGIDPVILTGDCADVYNPKTVRATMGAVFRQRVLEMDLEELRAWLGESSLRLYGAALSPRASDIRTVDLRGAAVAMGSEGRGLSREMLEMCAGEIIIPMSPDCESLNVASASAIILWELRRAAEPSEFRLGGE